ncbi:MAG: ABC transporter substrate-binding protein [Opitutales bacterium]|nr:ABC transporter substrate-binding protein [Opitutales bacterium]
MNEWIRLGLAVLMAWAWGGCSRQDGGRGLSGFPEPADGVVLQTDWFAQPEYAGFYQALAAGIYEAHGLKVTILEGGPNADPMKRLALKRAHFINARSDDAIVAVARGMPVRFVGVTLQHNPQAILSHEANAIRRFEDLDGKRIMVDVGAPWIRYLEKKYGIEMQLMPHNFGLNHFLSNPDFVMQCFLTNEPYYVRQKGAVPHVLPMWESGFDAYRGIIVHEDFLKSYPDVVRRFVQATHEGWHSYLYGDYHPAHRLIAERNPMMTDDFMEYIRKSLFQWGIVSGEGNDPSVIGSVDNERLSQQIEILHELGVIEKKVDLASVFAF